MSSSTPPLAAGSAPQPSGKTVVPSDVAPPLHTTPGTAEPPASQFHAQPPGSSIQWQAGTDDYTRAGQAVYTPLVLRGFDYFVYHLAMHAETREAIADLYARNVRSPHLEAGAGTSYSLAHCGALEPDTKLIVLDLNPNCLATSGRRLAPHNPTLVRADVLKPLPLRDGELSSIGLSYVVSVLPNHVPGGKWQVFEHLARALRDDGVLFGVVSPGTGVERSLAARIRYWLYNRVRILDNERDSLQDLEDALRRCFDHVDMRVIHGDVLFEARRPRSSGPMAAGQAQGASFSSTGEGRLAEPRLRR